MYLLLIGSSTRRILCQGHKIVSVQAIIPSSSGFGVVSNIFKDHPQKTFLIMCQCVQAINFHLIGLVCW